MSEAHTEAIRALLMDYYEQELQAELDQVIAEKEITQADLEARLNQ